MNILPVTPDLQSDAILMPTAFAPGLYLSVPMYFHAFSICPSAPMVAYSHTYGIHIASVPFGTYGISILMPTALAVFAATIDFDRDLDLTETLPGSRWISVPSLVPIGPAVWTYTHA